MTALLAVVTACAPAAAPSPPGAAAPPEGVSGQRAVQKPLVIALQREPAVLEASLQAQSREQTALVTAFLAYFTPQQQPVPYLAVELASIEKGTWKVFPDGRMESTFALRKDATWHDGQPLTAADFVFAHRVRTDPAYPGFGVDLERRIERALAVDPHTLTLEWKEAYLWAGMVALPDLSPMPVQVLEPLYLEGMEAFTTGPHWRERFVGSGPYRVESWEPGVELSLRAHERFVLGRPPIEHLRVRFISDANTVLANLLAGTVDLVPAHFGYPAGQALEQAGWDGRIEYWNGNPRALAYQMRDWGNLQRAVLDLRVRRATLHAIDRRAIVDALFGGKARVAHFWLPPSDPAWAAVDRTVTKYEFDRARAEALLREAGWARGNDGLARSPSGEPLHLPLLTTPGDVEQQEATTVVDNWKSVGTTSEIRTITPRELNDGEFRSKFSAVSYERRALTLENMSWTARQVSRPENRWSGSNRNGYVNPSLDDLWSRALGTVDTSEREVLLVEALKVMTEDAVVTPTHLQVEVMAYAAGLTGPSEPSAVGRAFLWNTWQWRWN